MSELSPTARLTAFGSLSDQEMALLKDLAGPTCRFSRGDAIITEGAATSRCYLLLDGWTASTITLPSGARQMLKVHMPGDLLGTPSLAYGYSAETVTAFSDVTVAALALAPFGRMFEEAPRLAAMLFLISQEERVLLMDRIAAMGRSTAKERLATVFLQLRARVIRSDPDGGDSFRVPLTQIDLADLAGITSVHVSRVLQQLRDDGLVDWTRGVVTIIDLRRLAELSGLPLRVAQVERSWLPAAR